MTRINLKSMILPIFMFTASNTAFAIEYYYDSPSKKCINSATRVGYNIGYEGECGRLSEVELHNRDYRSKNFKGAQFLRSSFNNSDFSDSDFTGLFTLSSDFEFARLVNAKLKDCSINQTKFERTNLANAKVSNCKLRSPIFRSSTLISSNFVRSEIENAEFIGADLTDSTFEKSYLESPNFSNANLANVVFNDVKFLGDINFRDASLVRADFSGANLHEADLTGADMSFADFRAADLRDVVGLSPSSQPKLSEAKYDFDSMLPFSHSTANELGMVYDQSGPPPAPPMRGKHVKVWTGKEMLIIGTNYCPYCVRLRIWGFDPKKGSWAVRENHAPQRLPRAKWRSTNDVTKSWFFGENILFLATDFYPFIDRYDEKNNSWSTIDLRRFTQISEETEVRLVKPKKGATSLFVWVLDPKTTDGEIVGRVLQFDLSGGYLGVSEDVSISSNWNRVCQTFETDNFVAITPCSGPVTHYNKTTGDWTETEIYYFSGPGGIFEHIKEDKFVSVSEILPRESSIAIGDLQTGLERELANEHFQTRDNPQIFVKGSKILFFGGDWSEECPRYVRRCFVKNQSIYDMETNTWDTIEDIVAYPGTTGVLAGDSILAWGGCYGYYARGWGIKFNFEGQNLSVFDDRVGNQCLYAVEEGRGE